MNNFFVLGAAATTAVLCGCESQQQMVSEMQPKAVQVARQRGAFELNCPAATAQVLSNEMIQTAAPTMRYAPPERAQYTVGVEGCGKRATYNVICAEGGTGCVATGTDNVVR